MSADIRLDRSASSEEFELEDDVELTIQEKKDLQARAMRAFRVGRSAPWRPRQHSSFIRQRLEPFVNSLVELLVRDLREHPPRTTK